MAFQAIADSKAAYQGSVPKVERTNVKIEKAETVSKAETPSVTQDVKAAPDKSQGLKSENETGNERELQGTEALKKAVEEINRNSKHSEAVYGVHDKTNRVTIKIVDKDTKEVLKEYPPEQTLDMIAKVWEMAGLMLDEKR